MEIAQIIFTSIGVLATGIGVMSFLIYIFDVLPGRIFQLDHRIERLERRRK